MFMSPLTNRNLSGMLGPYASLIYGGQAATPTQSQFFSPVQQQPPVYQQYPQASFGGYGSSQMPMAMMMFSIFQSMMQMMMAMFQSRTASTITTPTQDNSGTGVTTPAQDTAVNAPAPSSSPEPAAETPVETPVETPTYETPAETPVYETPVEEPVYETPTYEPPVYEEPKLKGSAGLYGDPKFGLFTPNVNVPDVLREFESGIAPGQTVTLLDDSDNGGLEIQATAVQVDPNNAASSGIGSATFKSGSDVIVISGNGDLTVNGELKGNINDAGDIAAIQLASGLTVSTSQQVDGANGETAERFVITNGEYKITAAARNPHPEANPYLDMNFEELTDTAADNAIGYQASIAGTSANVGIADLLRIETDGFSISA